MKKIEKLILLIATKLAIGSSFKRFAFLAIAITLSTTASATQYCDFALASNNPVGTTVLVSFESAGVNSYKITIKSTVVMNSIFGNFQVRLNGGAGNTEISGSGTFSNGNKTWIAILSSTAAPIFNSPLPINFTTGFIQFPINSGAVLPTITWGSCLTAPLLTTTAPTGVGADFATMNGNISSNGGSSLSSYGFYYSTTNNFIPPGAGTPVVVGTSDFTGNISSNLTGLGVGVTYYYKAYATNITGTTYGTQQSFATISPTSPPTVTTPTVTVNSSTSATLGANITSPGGQPVTARGTAYKTTPGVTDTDNPLADGLTASGVYTQSRTGLLPQQQYYYVGYATNSNGTAISPESSFTTFSNPPTAQPAGGTLTATPGIQSLTVNWGAATFPASGATKAGYIVVYATGGTATFTSVNGAIPVAGVGTLVNIGNTTLPTAPALTTTLSGLTGGATYSILLVPYTWDGSNTATYNYLKTGALQITAVAGNIPAAPVPPNRVATDVISAYSDTYSTSVTGIVWQGSPAASDITVSGNNTKYANNATYVQYASAPNNFSAMTFLHIDVYATSASAATMTVSTNNGSTTISTNANAWKSFDIPTSSLGTLTGVTLLKLQANVPSVGTAGTYYFDNVYYYRLPGPPTITSFTPSGCSGQTSIVITGTNYTGASAVTVGGVPVTSFVVNSNTQITATVAAASTAGTIAVTGLGGSVTSTASFSNITPTIPTATIASDNPVTTLAKAGNVITLTFGTSVTPGSTPTATISGGAAAVSGSGTSWTATRTVQVGDSNGTAAFTISYQNAAGCTAATRTTITSGSNVTIDNTAPTFPSVSIVSNNANTAVAGTGDVITLTFTTSEALSGTPVVTINGASASVSGSGTSWSATQTVTSCSGTVATFSISLSDVAGNPATRSTTTNGSQVSINPTPTATITSNNSPSCSGFTAYFGITGSNGATLTYTITGQALPQQLLLNGGNQSITLPGATSDVTLTLTSVTNANCTSSTFATGTSTVTVNPLPAPPTISAGGPTTFCSSLNVVLTSSAASGYLWSNGETTQSITVSDAGDYSVRAINSFGCLGTSSAVTTVTVTAQPAWYLDTDNDLYYTGSAVVQCASPGAGYTTAALSGGGDCDDTVAGQLGVPGNQINPGHAEVCYNNVDDNCSLTLSEGCAAVPVNMTVSYNGTTLPSLATAIPAVVYSYPGATNLKYRFTVTNLTTGAAPVEFTQTSRFVTIPASLHSSPGTFSIKASAVINEEVVAYAGNTITVNGPTIPKVTLAPGSCGATLASLTSTLTANAGLNATGYTFRIRLTSDNGPTPNYGTSSSSTRFVNANSFTGFPLSYGTSYQVSVQYSYTDPVTSTTALSGYGAECTVVTPSIPLTYLASPTCGSQVATLNANISAAAASYATSYQFRIRKTSDVGGPYTESAPNPSRFSSLTAFGLTLAYNTQYSISVRYSLVVNGSPVWSNYGSECIVKTPFFPTTQLVQSQCGLGTTTSLTQQLNIIPYPGFPNYKVRVREVIGEDLGDPQDITIAYSYFRLSQFSSVERGRAYSVSVAIILNGVVGDFSTECDLHTTELTAGDLQKETKPEFKATAYPNPFANNFMLDVKTTSQSSVNLKVYDMVGRLIDNRDVRVSDMESTTIGDQYPAGVYNVIVSQEDSVETLRVVKR